MRSVKWPVEAELDVPPSFLYITLRNDAFRRDNVTHEKAHPNRSPKKIRIRGLVEGYFTFTYFKFGHQGLQNIQEFASAVMSYRLTIKASLQCREQFIELFGFDYWPMILSE